MPVSVGAVRTLRIGALPPPQHEGQLRETLPQDRAQRNAGHLLRLIQFGHQENHAVPHSAVP